MCLLLSHMPESGRIIEIELSIDGVYAIVCGNDEWVDFHLSGVDFDEQSTERFELLRYLRRVQLQMVRDALDFGVADAGID